MRWIEFSVIVTGETAEAVTDLFSQYGHAGGVAVQEISEPEGFRSGPQTITNSRRVRVAAYTPLPEDDEDHGAAVAARQGLRDGLSYLNMITPIGELHERTLADEDWESAWREHFHPHRVGIRSVVVPTWRDYDPEPDDIIIRLDPGMAFGTGLHPTTQLCARELERRVQSGDTVLDVGCGSGILSIIAAQLGASCARGLDIDPVAVSAARDNVDHNTLSGVIEIREGTLPRAGQDPLATTRQEWPEPVRTAGGWDIIAANLTAEVLEELAEPLAMSARPGGIIIGSGIIADKFHLAASALMETGLRLIDAISDDSGDWRALILMRPAETRAT